MGLPPGSPLYSFEDRNTHPPSLDKDEAGEKVNGSLAIEDVAEDITASGSMSHGSRLARRLTDEESDEYGSKYDSNGSD